MQAATASLRLAARASQRGVLTRRLATAAATHAEAHGAAAAASPARKAAPVSLLNMEARWTQLTEEDQAAVHEQLEAVQQKDWKELSVDEKKAAYYVAFGPHGPRAPDSLPGDNTKIWLSVGALVGVAALLTIGFRQFTPPPPHTITKEWEEASNQRALEMKLNPITGISSEGYTGKGFVQTK
ncbi:hypothetical protein H1R20_g16060, partial [Candolleomyces eurysporus]